MKNTLMIVALAASAALCAETTQNAAVQKPQVCAANAAKACELSADEQAFSAKHLNDQNRPLFSALSPEQRQAVMESEKNGGNANEAVAKLASKHVSSHVAHNDKANPSQNKAAK